MKTHLFDDQYFRVGTPEGLGAYEKAMKERKVDVRSLIESGPGRLTADEIMVLTWYREAKARHIADSFDGPTQADVLLVGNPGTVGTINHQLDHIGGGLTSVMHGVDVAHAHIPDDYAEVKGLFTPRPLVSVAVMANKLSAYEINHDDMASKHRGLAALEKGQG